MKGKRGKLGLTPRTKKAVLAVIVTAVLAVLIIQLAVPPTSAATVSLNNLPSTLVIGNTYDFYVTINMQNGVQIHPNSIVTLTVFKSNSVQVESASFNGTGAIIATGGFLDGVSVYNGTPTNLYGYGGTTTGYFSYKVAIAFASGGKVDAGQYSMNASVRTNSTSPALNSAPDVFSVANSPNTFPIVPLFIAGDIVVIGVVVWVVMTMRRKR